MLPRLTNDERVTGNGSATRQHSQNIGEKKKKEKLLWGRRIHFKKGLMKVWKEQKGEEEK